jgi:hypothetical protein
MFNHVLAILLASTAAQPTAPAGAAPPAKPAPADCHDKAHRAFDFWLGEWEVSDTASGVPIAQSRIERIAGDCAIRETFTQTVGPNQQPIDYHGTSYSALNNADNTWRQMYVDNQGAALSYTGDLVGDAMVLTARAAALGTQMTVRPMPDGSVRQSGEATQDDGKTWAKGYDFTYRRRALTP